MSDRRQSKPHICLLSWMIPHEPMATPGPGSRDVPVPSGWATNYWAGKKTPNPSKNTNKKPNKNPLVFSGSVRSAADLFVEAWQQEGGSALGWRSGQYFYYRIHSRGEYLEPALPQGLLRTLVAFVVCVALQSLEVWSAGGLSSVSLSSAPSV